MAAHERELKALPLQAPLLPRRAAGDGRARARGDRAPGRRRIISSPSCSSPDVAREAALRGARAQPAHRDFIAGMTDRYAIERYRPGLRPKSPGVLSNV
jgi:hypothetical protein